MMIHGMGVYPEGIPRYKEPAFNEGLEEPREGRCYNCNHRCRINIDGREYDLCCSDRDLEAKGEVYVCDPDTDECEDWGWDGDEL